MVGRSRTKDNVQNSRTVLGIPCRTVGANAIKISAFFFQEVIPPIVRLIKTGKGVEY